MKLHKLYSNKETFKNIQFNLNGLNVIYAEVKTKIEDKTNSHNLGKTLLAEMIDFLLLKKISNRKKHFFYKESSSAEKFNDFVFYLEVLLNTGNYLTIRRDVNANTKISFRLSTKPVTKFNPPTEWDEESLGIDKARIKLQEYLNFTFFKDKTYDYRKSISYSLRRQGDYSDIYKLNKFTGGKDRDWKPFMFDLLGFDGTLLYSKYVDDAKIKQIKEFANNLRSEFNIDETKRDQLVGQIQFKKTELTETSSEVDKFNFYNSDKQLIREGVDDVENKISELNTIAYNLELDINQLKKSIKSKFAFDVNKVNKLFQEVQIFFPKQLKKDYTELIDFNSKITTERNVLLEETLLSKSNELIEIQEGLKEENKKKEELLSYIQDTDVFNKFKTAQKRLAKLESDLVLLNEKLSKIDLIIKKDEDKANLKASIDKAVKAIKNLSNTTEKNELYTAIRASFGQYYKDIMDEIASISWSVNKEGNVDFETPTVQKLEGQIKKATSQGDGYTYKKLLCVTFDLSILTNYSTQSYYKFVYHDDVLANESNGVKIRFLELINSVCETSGIQYILSVIKDDLPTDKENQPIYFSDEQIVLKLNDKDERGTLFSFNF